jgi:Lipocalin-like domain
MLKEQVAGNWTLASQFIAMSDGSRSEPYGADVKGSLMLAENGRFSFQVIGAERPKFRSNARREGTAEENAAAMHATETFFGTYSVDEESQSIMLNIERAILPNWDGTVRQYKMTIVNGELQLTGPPTDSATGPFIPHINWRRAK